MLPNCLLEQNNHPGMYVHLAFHLRPQACHLQHSGIVWFTSMSLLIFPAFPFLATLRAVMIITTHRRFLSWWHLEVLAIPQLSPCYPLSRGRSWHIVLYVRGHWGEATAGAWLQRCALSISLMAILLALHFWMADGCIVHNPLSACTHSACLACPARWLGFGSTRCSCWDRWLEKHLPPEPVN